MTDDGKQKKERPKGDKSFLASPGPGKLQSVIVSNSMMKHDEEFGDNKFEFYYIEDPEAGGSHKPIWGIRQTNAAPGVNNWQWMEGDISQEDVVKTIKEQQEAE